MNKQYTHIDDEWFCNICDYKGKTRQSITSHIWRKHTEHGLAHKAGVKPGHVSWNKGLTKETDERVRKTGETLKSKYKKGNIKPSYGNLGKRGWNKGITKDTDERVRKNTENIISSYKNGKVDLTNRKSISFRNKMSIIAKNRGFGGYTENGGHGTKFKVKDSFGKDVCLQSTYELKCSEILNELNVKWIRPTCLIYVIGNKQKRYYADFYLTEYNIFLDPKNDYLIEIDKEKIESVIKQNKIKLKVITEKQLNIDYFKQLLKLHL